MPVLRSISASQSSCRLLCHSNIRSCSLMCLALSQHHAALALSCTLLCHSITLLLLSHVPCFVSASRCSCSLMYLALSQHHAALALSCTLLCLSITLLLLSHVPCFVSASRCSCSLMCLALSQHHAALALSCALLCLSITLLLLSHVPCFVSASRCSCSLMCLALSQHHAALALSCALLCLSITLHSISCRSYSHVPSFVSVLLSQVLCFVSASLTPFLLSLMCLICLVTVHVHCFVSTSRRSYVVSGYHAALALYVPCFVRLSITMLSQVLRLSITPLMCLALSQHDITPLFSALPFP